MYELWWWVNTKGETDSLVALSHFSREKQKRVRLDACMCAVTWARARTLMCKQGISQLSNRVKVLTASICLESAQLGLCSI